MVVINIALVFYYFLYLYLVMWKNGASECLLDRLTNRKCRIRNPTELYYNTARVKCYWTSVILDLIKASEGL